MPWAQVQWKSELLAKETTAQVLIPQVGNPPYPTLYLLHSLGDDSQAWMRKTRLEHHVRNLPLLIVLPDGYRGFFTDNNEGPPYARHIGEELVAFIERTFQARPERDARAIGGASMGGYGAMRVGLAYSDKFCSVHSHSGSLDRHVEFLLNPEMRTGIMKQRPNEFVLEMRRIFGERPKGSSHDVLYQAIAARQRGTLPRIRFDCGVDDYLIHANRSLHEDLDAAGIQHSYLEFPGAHNWEYCNAHIEEALAFHATNLHLQKQS